MDNYKWLKSQTILVARADQGLKLINLKSNRVCNLDSEQAKIWINWNEGTSSMEESFLNELIEGEFIVHEESMIVSLNEFSQIVPSIASKNIKWNEETPDLYILFNSSPSKKERSVLILGTLGSMCWKGIINGYTINQICEVSTKVFGNSKKVIPLLKRLINDGFINQIDSIELINDLEDNDINEISVQELLKHIPHLNVPWYCSWEICSACNLRCKHCYLPDYNNLGLSNDKAMAVVKQLIESGIFNVIIMGGEPLLRNDIEIIVNNLREGGIYVSIITNGQLLTLERAKSLVAAGVEMFFISFDGFSKEIHEMTRGKDTFDNSIKAIKNAQQAGVSRTAVSWAIHDMNMHEYKYLPEFMNSLDVSECYMEVFKKTGLSGSKAPFNPISVSEVGIIKNSINEWKEKYPHLYISFNTQCLCGRNRMKIGDDGVAYICPFSDEKIGNLFEKPLIDLWQSIESKIPIKGPAGYCKTVRELYLLHMYG